MSWACVLFEDKVKEAVHVTQILKFHPEGYGKNKQFNINHSSGVLKKGVILFLKGKTQNIHSILSNHIY